MKKSVWIITSCMLIFGVHTLCGADSLLVPMQFPKTFNDLDFITRTEIKAEGYNRYADLNPYEKFILEQADENLAQEIAADAAQVEQQQNQSAQNSGNSAPSAPNTPNTASNPSTPTTTTNDTPQIGGYCKMRNPDIPQNQKIPFGSPVLHEHFIYCAPYGMVNRGSGLRRHEGYDIGCSKPGHESFGDPVFATADGVVEIIKPNQRGKSHGNYIMINHGNGFKTWYMHLNEMFVTVGQNVSAGCQIGTIGNTGGSRESIRGNNDAAPQFRKKLAHVHYEMWYYGSARSVTSDKNNKNVLITHAWSDHKSIDPTHFICIYGNFAHGHCRDTFPYSD